MNEQIQCGLFTAYLDRPITDAEQLTDCRMELEDLTGDRHSLQFGNLEFRADDKDPRRVYCHGLSPKPDDDRLVRRLPDLVRVCSCTFSSGSDSDEGLAVCDAVDLEVCILQVCGRGIAPNHPETPAVYPSFVQGVDTYTIFYQIHVDKAFQRDRA